MLAFLTNRAILFDPLFVSQCWVLLLQIVVEFCGCFSNICVAWINSKIVLKIPFQIKYKKLEQSQLLNVFLILHLLPFFKFKIKNIAKVISACQWKSNFLLLHCANSKWVTLCVGMQNPIKKLPYLFYSKKWEHGLLFIHTSYLLLYQSRICHSHVIHQSHGTGSIGPGSMIPQNTLVRLDPIARNCFPPCSGFIKN